MLPLVVPALVLAAMLALAARVDVRQGARMPLAAAGAVGGLIVGWVAVGALRASILTDVMPPDRYVQAVSLLALGVGGVALLVRRLPPRFPFTLAALLPLAGLLLSFRLGLWALAVAATLACATWPWALAQGGRGRAGDVALAAVTGTLLVGGSLAGSLYALIDASEGSAGAPAEHAWSLEVRPEGEGAYELRAPLFVAGAPRAVAPLEGLRQALRVVEGDAEVSLAENGTVVVVRGEGHVRLVARHAFFGPIGAREAFHDYLTSPAPFTLTGVPAAEVTWGVDFSGGKGHTCWRQGEVVVRVVEGTPAPLDQSDRPIMTACA